MLIKLLNSLINLLVAECLVFNLISALMVTLKFLIINRHFVNNTYLVKFNNDFIFDI